jgi:hypothetical protein
MSRPQELEKGTENVKPKNETTSHVESAGPAYSPLFHANLIERIFALEARIAADEERWSRKILQARLIRFLKRSVLSRVSR